MCIENVYRIRKAELGLSSVVRWIEGGTKHVTRGMFRAVASEPVSTTLSREKGVKHTEHLSLSRHSCSLFPLNFLTLKICGRSSYRHRWSLGGALQSELFIVQVRGGGNCNSLCCRQKL